MPVLTLNGNVIVSWSIPSILYRTITSFSCGSMCISEALCKTACLKIASTILTIGISSACFCKACFSVSPFSGFTIFTTPDSLLISSPNSAFKLSSYCLSAFFMLATFVSRGRIFRFAVFFTKSIVCKSSGSSIATSSLFPSFL